MAADLTVVIPTRNEAKNLPRCLASLEGWVSSIVIVDSLSTDDTVAIARQAGATVIQHAFENYPAQWLWIFQTVPVHTQWILAIDADHRVTPALRERILQTLPKTAQDLAGYYVDRQLVFRGRLLRWGGCTRPQLKLFRTGRATCDDREAPDIHFYVDGKVEYLRTPLLEDNLNELDLQCWIAKQRSYVRVIADTECRWLTQYRAWKLPATPFGTTDQRTLWRKQLWYRMPRFVRPCLYFFHRYIVLGGFLDGWAGLLYHSIQGFWLRWCVDMELGRRSSGRAPA